MKRSNTHAPWRRVLSLLLCLLVVCGLSTAALRPAEAKDNRTSITKLAFGRRVHGKCYNWNMSTNVWTYKLYKITVPKNGYLTVTNNLAGEVQYSYFYVYQNSQDFINDKRNYGNTALLRSTQLKKTIQVPVKPGTYYLHSEGWGADVYTDKSFDFSVKFTAKSPDTNITKAKAALLKSGAKSAASIVPGGKTYRWFKLPVTKAKAIRIICTDTTGTERSFSVSLVNAKGKAVAVTKDKYGAFTTAKLPRGTYYLKVKSSGAGTFKVTWK